MEPALDAINYIDPHIGAIMFFILALLVHNSTQRRMGPVWFCIAALVRYTEVVCDGF